MPGVAHGFHEGSRSEYLAAYVFSAFGTASAIPHQEDHGFDLYCTLSHAEGRTRFAVKPYTVQVKSTDDPWMLDNPGAVRWFIEHPLPMFLCIVHKQEQRIMVFQTSPKYYYWTFGGALPSFPSLKLVPNLKAVEGECKLWHDPGSADLGAPILNFTLDQLGDKTFYRLVRDVLDSWLDLEYQNLFQVTTGTRQWISPPRYRTNNQLGRGTVAYQFGPAAAAEEVRQVMSSLKYSLAWVMHQAMHFKDWPGALRVALLLRHFCRDEDPDFAHWFCNPFDELLGVSSPPYVYATLDRIAAEVNANITPPNAEHNANDTQLDQIV